MHRKPGKIRNFITGIGWKRWSVTAILVAAISLLMGPSSFANASTLIHSANIANNAVHNWHIADGTLTWKDQGPYMRAHTVVSVAYADNGDIVTTYLDGHTSTSTKPSDGGTPPPTGQTCKLANGVGTSITDTNWVYDSTGANLTQGNNSIKVSKTGKVHLNVTNGDAGVVVPLGTVADVFKADGTLKDYKIGGSGADKATWNLWVDNNGDNKFGMDVQSPNTPATDSTKDTYYFKSSNPTKTGLGDTPDTAMVWAWVGTTNTGGVTLTKFHGDALATCS